jgi:serpin B
VPVLFSAPLDPTTLLVLVDAVYFNAKWATPFPHAGTAPSAFHLQSGSTVQVRFMNLASDDVETANPAGLTALELPYRGGRFAALVLEPTSTTLGTFVAELTPGRLSSILAALRPAQLGVALPTVDLSNSSSLNSPLSTLGMGVAFSDEAELSGIANNPRLRVSTVRQVATLRIDESGTVAAAATGIGLVPTAVAAPRRVVRIDQPFVVLVRDERTGAIVFEATVVNPASS